MRSRKNNRRFQLSNRFKFTSKFAIVITLILVVFQIYTAIQMSSTSAVLAELEGEALKIAKENEELKDMIIKDNSLISVRDRSEDLGYTSPNTTFYITKEDSVALLE